VRLCPADAGPQLLETLTVIRKAKWLALRPIRISIIACVGHLSDINSHNKCFWIDDSTFFWFTHLHGYAPLLIWLVTSLQLAQIKMSIAFFRFMQGLLHYSKLGITTVF